MSTRAATSNGNSPIYSELHPSGDWRINPHPLQRRLRTAVKPLVGESEQVRAVIPAQANSPLWNPLPAGVVVLLFAMFVDPVTPNHFAVWGIVAVAVAGAAGWLIFGSLARPRLVVVTDQRRLFLTTRRLNWKQPAAICGELPAEIPLGPPTGALWSVIIGVDSNRTQRFYVHRRFYRQLRTADSAIHGN